MTPQINTASPNVTMSLVYVVQQLTNQNVSSSAASFQMPPNSRPCSFAKNGTEINDTCPKPPSPVPWHSSFPGPPSRLSTSSSQPRTMRHGSFSELDGDLAGDSDLEGSMSARPPPLPSRHLRPVSMHNCSETLPSVMSNCSTSSCSTNSSDSDTSNAASSPSIHLQRKRPPPPPPRTSIVPHSMIDLSLKTSDRPSPIPPPLPHRPNTTSAADLPPRLPARPPVVIPSGVSQTDLSSSISSGSKGSPASYQERKVSPASYTERKSFHAMPPPPTRTIALGDKLPPARRQPSLSSDEESGDEEDPRARLLDALPDSSRSSRHPPVAPYHSEPNIQVPAYTGHVVVAGHDVLVATHHHVKGYNLAKSDSHSWHYETKELGMKEVKIACLEFKASKSNTERASAVWLGTKEGHLIELDVRTGRVLGTKPVAHAHTITHIFRLGTSMITVDDAGKVLVWSPDSKTETVHLSLTQPTVFRIVEKVDFARILGGYLWTSARSENSSGFGKGPVVRVYDVFAPGSVGLSLVPTEAVGAVTAGTLLPCHPGFVYLGHEAGFVSIWALKAQNGTPRCVDTLKVSTSDVLSLEGVNNRLWVGGRNGTILAFDVSTKPWIVTNAWTAHSGLPVMKLLVDPFSVDKCGMLHVVSVGRDERIRFWDGLLGAEWISKKF